MNGRILSARRALICVVVGVVAGIIAAVTIERAIAPLLAWCTAGVIALAWVWRICWPQGLNGLPVRSSPSPV